MKLESFLIGEVDEKRAEKHVHSIPLYQETHGIALDSVSTCDNIWIFINSLFCYMCDR